MKPSEMADKLLPADEDDPNSVRRYRLRTSIAAYGAAFGVCAVAWAAIFGYPLLGRLAWGNETERQIDFKVAAAVTPIQEQVRRIEEAVRTQGEDTQEVIVALIASEIRASAAARCLSQPGPARERENRTIEELQRKYTKRTGAPYDVPRCSEL